MSIAKNRLNINRISSAYHEAGHVVLAVAGLQLPKKATINPRGVIAGETTTLVPTVPFSCTDDSLAKLSLYLLHSHLRMLLGGFAAEKNLFRSLAGDIPSNLALASDKDLVTYRRIVKKSGIAPNKEARKELRKILFDETLLFVERHWGVVKAVAHVLIDKDEIEYNDIRRVMLDSKISPRYWKRMFRNLEELVSACKGKI